MDKVRISILFRKRNDSKWHINFILHLVSIIKPTSYLEVGIFRCGLFNQVIPYADSLVGIDIDSNAGRYMKSNSKCEFINSSSLDFFKKQIEFGRKFDFIFIDGDHSKEAVEADFFGAFNVLNDNGIMLLHDTYPLNIAATARDRCDDGYQTIDKLSRLADQWEMMTIPIHPGLTLCRKRIKQVSWQ
jgi:predicted O-methyltransferase YrrM